MFGILLGVIALVILCGIAIAKVQPRQYGKQLDWNKKSVIIEPTKTIGWFEYMDLMDKKNESKK